MKRAFFIFLSLLIVVAPARGQVVVDYGVAAGISAQLTAAASQIAKMSEMVSAAREQLSTLTQVANGIRDLQRVVSGGVQGLLGDVSDQLGLKDVFMVGKQLQSTFNDGMQLYHDVRSLPEEAKQQLRNIGVAVDDVEKYLSQGVVYDAFSGLAIDDWRKVFTHPVDALANGTVGRAVIRTDAYLDTEDLRAKFADELSKMTPEERARIGEYSGVNMGLLNYAAWAKGMENRMKKVVDFSVLAEKSLEAAGGKGRSPTVNESTAALNGSVIGSIKVSNEFGREQAEGQAIGNEQLLNQTMLMNKRDQREGQKKAANTMLATPGEH